jgi:uncharacterized protein with HEPN domain
MKHLKELLQEVWRLLVKQQKKIPADVKVKWNTIQWKNMAGMRDRLIHDYMGINYTIVWDVVKNKIPVIHKQILDYLN